MSASSLPHFERIPCMPDPVLYNTLTREKEPLSDQSVGIYVCGVTPYDTTHLGHAFTYTAFDVLIRYLRFLGRKVTYVRNVTDIDDDILLRARSHEMHWKELGDREYAKFATDMEHLNNLPPEHEPRATEHIPDIVQIIEGLLAKGCAYASDGNVYFDVKNYAGFGDLCGLSYVAQLELANERGNFPADPLKHDPLDFVLWQAKKDGEPSWPSPWGEGRPGWHIECSAMSMKYLGDSFAIHGGGGDLVFPHHEAEIAQSECLTGKPFVRFWMHTGMLYCGEHKMSKSLGNMVFLADLLPVCPPDAIRLYLLGHHYREPWNHDRRELATARTLARKLSQALNGGLEEASPDEIEHCGSGVLAALADDLDTTRAIEELRKLAFSGEHQARRVGRTLSEHVLGLTFEA
ncbi:MAG: cysteine--tRNA ligase [Chloroflexi bacterium]|nr:MAG: cysteine--tRNA ligase [Chloroflexota bacterium]